MQVFPIGEDDAQPGWGMARPQAAFLPSSSVEETDLDTEMERMDSPPAASLGRNSLVSMRGAVLAPVSPANTTSGSHPTAESVLPTVAMLPRSMFSLRGELMHVFVSYRVTTEGGAGNGMSGLLAAKIRALSVDSTSAQELRIPRHGWGIWPKGAKKPVPFRKEEAKVFLDRDCLQDGQSWLAGFVQGSNPNPTTSTPNSKNSNPNPQTMHPAPCNLNPAP